MARLTAQCVSVLAILLLSSLPNGSAAPYQHERRQALNKTLGGLAGLIGVDQTFDYVVIGAGTAGLAMAARLSDDPTKNVAVIEAGTFYEVANVELGPTPSGDVIFCGSSPLDTNPLVDWEFITTPQTGANNREIHYARGRCLGGSSARNFMIYQRGTNQSYQKWADQVDDQSYTFDNLFPFFEKSVQFTPPDTTKRAPNASAEFNPAAFSPAGGPLHVSYPNYAQPFSSYMQGGMNAIGIPTTTDFNSGNLLGTQYAATTIDPGQEIRSSSEESFLAASASKTNLKVFSLTMAKKIQFDSNKQATGVLVSTAGLPYTLSVTKEVIVSGGAFHSPQMLMVSGIGPAATLEANGIPVLVDNPNVGQNMWDHIFFGPSYRVTVPTLTSLANDPVYLAAAAAEYSLLLEGPLTNPVADFLAWEKVPADFRTNFSASTLSDLSQFPADWPEIEYLSGAGYVGDFSDLLTEQPKDGFQYATILAALVTPISRGNVTIISSDTDDLPVINPNWLTSPTDQEVAVAAYKRNRLAFASPAMQSGIIGPEFFPGPSVQTDADILEVIRNTLLTVWHASCTCAMGKIGDPKAVVDTNARVMGVQGVRVVDASAFPLLPPGHPQSTIYVLAEKIAADIMNGN